MRARARRNLRDQKKRTGSERDPLRRTRPASGRDGQQADAPGEPAFLKSETHAIFDGVDLAAIDAVNGEQFAPFAKRSVALAVVDDGLRFFRCETEPRDNVVRGGFVDVQLSGIFDLR